MKAENKEKLINYLRGLIFRCLMLVVIFLSLAIIVKKDISFRDKFILNVYEKSFSFSKINKLYNKYFGKILPIEVSEVSPVFSETLEYSDSSIYHDGVKLTVNDNYLVPVIESGMVNYIGEKENYGNVIIINTENDLNIWYGNIDVPSVKLYDYVEKGSYLGNTKSNNLFLVFSKDNNFLDYNEYLE